MSDPKDLPAQSGFLPDQFLSEEDLDLKNLTFPELLEYWDLWLHQAQASNDQDEDTYSHGVFMLCKVKSLASKKSGDES